MAVLSRSRRRMGRQNRITSMVDALESRLLMSASVVEYPVPDSGNLLGVHVTSDPAGNVYSMSAAGGIVKLDPSTGTQTFMPLPSQSSGFVLTDITYGPDGNLWVTESFGNPASVGVNDQYLGDVLKVSTSGAVLATYNLGTTYGQPFAPTAGADGKIYMVNAQVDSVAADGTLVYDNDIIAMNTNGTFSTYHIGQSDGQVTALAASSDGDVFAAFSGTTQTPEVGDTYTTQSRIAVIHDGVLTMVSIDDAADVVDPYGRVNDLTLDPDGNLWMPLYSTGESSPGLDQGTDQILKVSFDDSYNPSFTSYSIPGEAPGTQLFPIAVIASTDGSIWVGEEGGTNIDRVNTATNTVDQIAIPSGASGPSLGTQVGNAIYFTEGFTGNFAKIDLPVNGMGLSFAGLATQNFSGAVAGLNTTLSAAQVSGLTATVQWGDSTTSTGTIVNNGNGTLTVNGTHAYASPGDYVTNVIITGSGIDPVRVSGDATIVPSVSFAAAGLPVAGHQENSTFGAAVATFIGPTAAYTATINWGNGVTTAGTVTLVSGVYTVGGSINYATQGNYNITVSISGGSNAAVVTTSVVISDIPLVVTAQAPVVLLGRIAIGVTATFTDDPDSSFTRYSASINWGDGSSSAGLILPTGTGQYTVLGLHTYKKAGNYTLTTTINTTSGEDAGAHASASEVLHV